MNATVTLDMKKYTLEISEKKLSFLKRILYVMTAPDIHR
jgi:hypothetical protein